MLWFLVCGLVGLVLGAALAWLATSAKSAASRATAQELRLQLEKTQAAADNLARELGREREEKTRAQTELANLGRRLEEERSLLAQARQQLGDAFQALAVDALKKSEESFLQLAQETFGRVLADARGDLGKREQAIEGLVKPLAENLQKFEEHVRALENSRQRAYAGLENYLKALSETQQQLQKETAGLVRALRNPQVRGRWGELTLRRVAELAGMSSQCDFTEQVTATTEEGRLRPDMIVHLPGGRQLVVDAKVALDAYLEAVEADTEEKRQQALARHAAQVRSHLMRLAGKDYWKQFDPTPEFVVMFIPGESFFTAALEQDRKLVDSALEQKVILATPATLVALIKAVAYSWRQEQLNQNARQISELGKELYERMRVLAEHLSSIGKGLENATSAYNKAVGSLEARVFPGARKLAELGVNAAKEIPQLEAVEASPRLPSCLVRKEDE